MRLFVAINLPEEIGNYLRSVQEQLPDAEMNLTKDFHLTLQFLGEVSADQAMEIKSALYHVFMPHLKFKLGKIGVFKSRDEIKVVWTGLECPEELMRVKSEVEEQLAPIGFFNDKLFKPHLTLARVKSCGQDFEKELGEIEVMEREFEVDTFELMESCLSPSGAKYEILETYKS
jgi:RNA 2',3'-cyclic 3'-phosphodiesterase